MPIPQPDELRNIVAEAADPNAITVAEAELAKAEADLKTAETK